MTIIASLSENNKIQQKNVIQVSTESGSQSFGSAALLSELLRQVLLGRSVRSLYGHDLLVLTKLSKSKIQVVQEQKTV